MACIAPYVVLTVIAGIAAEPTPRPNVLLLLADNWAYPHAGCLGDPHAQTPNFDRLAREGVLFTQSYCQVPSCSPARAVLLTGQCSHRLGPGASLHGDFPANVGTYPQALAEQGYAVGFTGKGWAPGKHALGNNRNPAGSSFRDFAAFLSSVRDDQPFCFWWGSRDPHRPWEPADAASRPNPDRITPGRDLPNVPVVRADIADYYAEVARFDREVGVVLDQLRASGRERDTLVIIAGDNGWQMPRGLANVYDVGTRVPCAMRWPAKWPGGQQRDDIISFEDIAPTILAAADVPIPNNMPVTGSDLFASQRTPRNCVFLERERHANVRAGNLGYPCRAIRTREHLLIWNIEPDRWPAGDPQLHFAVGPFGDVDAAPTKDWLLDHRDHPDFKPYFQLGFGKRPEFELYDLRTDPEQLRNVADQPEFNAVKTELMTRLQNWMRDTTDPRAKNPHDSVFDQSPYYGQPPNRAATQPRPPNVVLVLCDNLGYGDLSCYGATQQRTPNVDKLAADGMRFTHCYAASGVCTPSRAALMTGCYPRRVNMHLSDTGGAVLQPVSPKGLHPDEITIAEVLRTADYATHCIGKWHLGDQPAFLPMQQGFDDYFGIPYSDDMTPRAGKPWPDLPLMRGAEVVSAPVDRDQLTRWNTEEAQRFLVAHRDRPFFLFLSQAMPGSTTHPFSSAAFRGRSQNGDWGDSVEELDWSLSEIVRTLELLKLADNTLVIFTNDNGAPRRQPEQGNNRPLPGWGYSTDEGGMRVPLIAKWPGRIPVGTECAELVTLMDLLPTLASMAQAAVPTDRIIDGRNITPVLFGRADAISPHEAFFYYQGPQLQAVRDRRYKLTLPLTERLGLGATRGSQPLALYDLIDDVSQSRNLVEAHPEIVARLTALAEQARRDLGDTDREGTGTRPAGHAAPPTPRTLVRTSSR
jgi:arylsulfatase A